MATRKRGAKSSPGQGRAAPRSAVPNPEPRTYDHPEAKTLLRPDIGTQASFRKKKPPRAYRYDSSFSPALSWDGQNTARELGDWLIGLIEEASRLDPPHEFSEPRRTRPHPASGKVALAFGGGCCGHERPEGCAAALRHHPGGR